MKEIYLTDETKGLSPKEVNQALEALLAQFPHVKKSTDYSSGFYPLLLLCRRTYPDAL